MPRRLALLAAVLLAILPAAWARLAARPAPPRGACAPEGRGVPPRRWIGCAADPGPRRVLDGRERLSMGLPLDPNAAAEADLALVPGLSRPLAAAIVADRARRGPFEELEDLGRVRGIGPRRLALARPRLRIDRTRAPP